MFLLYYVQVGSQNVWVWPTVPEIHDRPEDVNGSSNAQHQELTSAVSNMRGDGSNNNTTVPTTQDPNLPSPVIEKYRFTYPGIYSELRKMAYYRQQRIIEVLDGDFTQEELRAMYLEEFRINSVMMNDANHDNPNPIQAANIHESNMVVRAIEARLEQTPSVPIYGNDFIFNRRTVEEKLEIMYGIAPLFVTYTPQVIQDTNNYDDKKARLLHEIRNFSESRKNRVLEILNGNFSVEELKTKYSEELGLNESLRDMVRSGKSSPSLHADFILTGFVAQAIQLKLKNQGVSADEIKAIIPSESPIQTEGMLEYTQWKTSTTTQNQTNTPTPKATLPVKNGYLYSSDGERINFTAIAKYKGTYPPIYERLSRLGDSKQKPIIEILEGDLSVEELNKKIAEERSQNAALREQIKTTEKDSSRMLWANIHYSDLVVIALQTKLTEKKSPVTQKQQPLAAKKSPVTQNPVRTDNSNDSVKSQISLEDQELINRLQKEPQVPTVKLQSTGDKIAEIIDKLISVQRAEHAVLTYQPKAEFYYGTAKKIREDAIKEHKNLILRSDGNIKNYEKKLAAHKNKYPTLDSMIKEMETKSRRDPHNVKLQRQIKALKDERLRREDFQRNIATSQKDLKNGIIALKKLEAKGPSKFETNFLQNPNQDAEILESGKKLVKKLYADLVKLRKELDKALGRPEGNYEQYLTFSVGSFGRLAQELFGINRPLFDDTTFRTVGSFKPKINKTNQPIYRYISQPGGQSTTASDINL